MSYQSKKIDFNLKIKIIDLSGKCFWYWDTFYSFLESCGISPNIYKQFDKSNKYQVMRSVLGLLERQEKHELIQNIVIQFYNFEPTEDCIDRKKALKLLKDFRNIVGDSIVENEVNKKEREDRIEKEKIITKQKKIYKDKLSKMKNDFFALYASPEKQRRGYNIEKLFFDILELEEFDCTRPYKNENEQIDGHFKYDAFDYLIEIKWTSKKAKQIDFSIFNGKITGKAQSTRGLFLSING